MRCARAMILLMSRVGVLTFLVGLIGAHPAAASCMPFDPERVTGGSHFEAHVEEVDRAGTAVRAELVVQRVFRGDFERGERVRVRDANVGTTVETDMRVGERYEVLLARGAASPYGVSRCQMRFLGTVPSAGVSPIVIGGALLLLGLAGALAARARRRGADAQAASTLHS